MQNVVYNDLMFTHKLEWFHILDVNSALDEITWT